MSGTTATREPIEPSPERWSGNLPVIGVWCAALVVFSVGSWRPHWNPDEGATVVVVRSGWADAWRLAGHDAALAPYYLAIKPWAAVSTSHLWLRLPSALAAATMVALVFVLARRAVGARAAWSSAALLVVFPAVSRYAGFARPYTLAALGCVVVVLCWWQYLEDGRIRSAAGMVGGFLIAGLSHPYALLVAVPLVVAALVAPLHERWRDLVRTLVPGVVALVLLAPWLWHVVARAHGSPNPLPVTAPNVTRSIWLLPVTGQTRRDLVLAGAILLLGLAGVATGWSAGGRARTLAVVSAVWLLASPLLLTAWQVVTDKPGLVTRYLFFCIPALALLAGTALARIAAGRREAAVAVLLGLAALSLRSHSAIRLPDAFAGQRYVDLVEVMHLPQLQTAPLLIRGPSYRALLANDGGAAARIPLMVGTPDRPLDLIHPHPQRAGSPAWQETLAAHPSIIVYQGQGKSVRASRRVTPRMLLGQAGALQDYDEPDVLCAFHGDRLGVFSQDPGTFTAIERVELAEEIEAVNPRRITCWPAE